MSPPSLNAREGDASAGQHMAPSPAVRLEEISIDEAGQVLASSWAGSRRASHVRRSRPVASTDDPTRCSKSGGGQRLLLIVGFAISGVGLMLAFWVPMRDSRQDHLAGRRGGGSLRHPAPTRRRRQRDRCETVRRCAASSPWGAADAGQPRRSPNPEIDREVPDWALSSLSFSRCGCTCSRCPPSCSAA